MSTPMDHKTLLSYHRNQPVDPHDEHPDGLLWPMTKHEWEQLPKGTRYEDLRGKMYLRGTNDIVGADNMGNRLCLRGRRDD